MTNSNLQSEARAKAACTSEILILPNGEVLAHRLTPVMARLLGKLNTRDGQFQCRGEKTGRRRNPISKQTQVT